MQNRLKQLSERWKAFAATPRGKWTVKALRTSFAVAVLSVLAYQVTRIGWSAVLNALPTNPLYYVLLLAMYFLLPVTEAWIYAKLWGLKVGQCLSVMIRKRVLNVDMIGYSGEVYLFLWARDRVAMAARSIMAIVKDNLIVSSAASLGAAALLIGVFLLTGQINLDAFVSNANPYYAALSAVVIALLSAIAFRFRGVLFSLPQRTIAALGAAHLSRFLTGYVLQILQWWVVIPTASFETWAVLLVVFVLINRIPFMPSSDLVFVTAGVGLTPMLDIPVAPVVSMLLVRSAGDRLLNLAFFAGSVWNDRQGVSTNPESVLEPGGGMEVSEVVIKEGAAAPMKS